MGTLKSTSKTAGVPTVTKNLHDIPLSVLANPGNVCLFHPRPGEKQTFSMLTSFYIGAVDYTKFIAAEKITAIFAR